MKFHIMDECCMALETAEVIARYVNREDYQETKSKMLTRYGAQFKNNEKAEFIKRIGMVAEASATVQEQIVLTPEMEFLFRKHYYDNTYSSLASIILLNFGDVLTCNIEDYMNSCLNKWKVIMDSKVHLRMVAYSALVFEPGEKPFKEVLMDDLDQLDYPSEFKWSLLKIFMDFEKYVQQLKDILSTVDEPMRNALKGLDSIAQGLKDFWKDNLTEELVMELADSMNLSMDNIVDKEVVLQILRMPCDQAIIDDQWQGNKLPVLLGLAIEWGPQFIDEQLDVSHLCEELRMLGEDSKFEIMQMLKKEGSYGQEIARKLGLDAATVSRHLNALARYGLIYVERKEKRNIYYKVNQSELRNLLELMQRIFFE